MKIKGLANLFKKKEYYYIYPDNAIITDSSLKNTILDKEVTKHDNLVFTAGIDENGKRVVIDLEKAPHLLVGGIPGFGKSVFVNNILYTMLLKNNPNDLLLYIIDPKRIDYVSFDGLPHLKKRARDNREILELLNSLYDEMMKRFEVMEKIDKVDNIRKCKKHFPQIILVFDEYSSIEKTPELKEIRHKFEVIAKLGRASGIHIIVSLQNPKATDIPTTTRDTILLRVAFHAADKNASRVILASSDIDASKLTIPGDGYAKLIDGTFKRFKGAYINNADMNRIIDWWKKQPTSKDKETFKKEFYA